jgi:RNA polymerase sigma-70 factor (ECF subfamily)
MGTRNRYHGIEEYAVKLIQHKAYQLVGNAGFTDSDREDIEQDLLMDLLSRLPDYDPELAERATFITRIVNRRVARILEKRSAWRRDYRLNEFSLNENDWEDDNSVERHENIGEDEYLLRTGKQELPTNDLRDLIIDVNRVLEILPPEFRDLCERLKTKTVAEVSRETGIPRGTIYESIQKVRELFQEAGLKDYLKT